MARSDAANNSVKAVQFLMAGVIVLYIAFTLALPAIVTSLNERNNVRHLYAWLQLRDFTHQLPKKTDASEVRRLETKDLSCAKGDPHRRDGKGYAPECPYVEIAIPNPTKFTGADYVQLQLKSFWPVPSYYSVRLYRHRFSSFFWPGTSAEFLLEDGSRAEFYDVETNTDLIPYSEYEIARVQRASQEMFLVLQRDPWGHGRSWNEKTYLQYRPEWAEPKFWDATQLLLLRGGISRDLDKLALTDQDLVAFITQIDTGESTISVLGIDVPSSLTISLFNVILAIMSFLMLGPLRVLQACKPDATEIDRSWVMVTKSSPNSRWWSFEKLLVAISLTFAIGPIIIAVIQIYSGVLFQSGTLGATVLVVANLASAAFSTYILARVALELRRWRET